MDEGLLAECRPVFLGIEVMKAAGDH